MWALSEIHRVWFEARAVGANAQAAPFLPDIRGRCNLDQDRADFRRAWPDWQSGRGCGPDHYVTLDMSPGYGYAGIVVADAGGLHPSPFVPAAIFIAGMFVGADSMSRAVGVPTYIADVIVAVALLAVLVATQIVRYRVRWR